MELTRCIKLYLIAMRQEGKSDATLRQYGWHLDRLSGWFADRGVTSIRQVSRDLLREWGAGLHDGWAPATVRQAVSAARSFLTWCRAETLIDEDLAHSLRVPDVKVRLQRTLTAAEIQGLVAACPQTPLGLRNRALICLLADSGLRASEICRLQVANTHIPFGTLTVIGKGGDQEMAYFGETTAAWLAAWLAVREAAPRVKALFVSIGGVKPGHPLTPSGLRHVLRRLGTMAGIDGVSPHAFRRAFACIATEAGVPSRVLQKAGRWSDIRMVERYTMGLNVSALYRLYSPVEFLERCA